MAERDLNPTTPEAVLRAARKHIPRAFRGKWVNQSGVVVLRPESKYMVTGQVWLAAAPRTGRFALMRRHVVRSCGRAVANASWAVTFSVPESESVMYANAGAVLTPTKTGWRLWYPRLFIS